MFESFLKPPVTIATLTGSIVTFNSQYAGLPLKSHVVEVVATQSGSGTPSPDNVRTINGWSAIGVGATGKNLINWESLNLHGWGGSDSDLVAQFNNLKEGDYAIQFKIKVITLQSGYDAGNYGLLIRAVNNGVNFNITMRADKTDVSEGDIFTYTATFTLTSDYVGKFTSAYYYTGRSPANNSDYCDFYDFQVEKGSTVTDYEPFGTYTTIQIGSTVYGGEYDARTGVLTATHGFITINGSASWNEYASGKYYVDGVYPNYDLLTPSTPISNIYEFEGNGASGSGDITTDHKFYMRYQLGRVWVYDSDYPSLSDFTTMLTSTPMQIAYELATPQTIQLPPCPIDTLLGVNNIWADTGDTTLQYFKFG